MPTAAIALTSVVTCVVMVLTAIGAHRRGGHTATAVASGLCFPLTWVVWYLRDELRPAGRAR